MVKNLNAKLRKLKKLTLSFLAALICISAFGADSDAQSYNIPRFENLKSSEANIRSGPGLSYDVLYKINAKDTPVEIIEEFENWRKVKDITGESGWVHKALINQKRSAFVKKASQNNNQLFIPLLEEPKTGAQLLASIEIGSSVFIDECLQNYCLVEKEDSNNLHYGWVSKGNLWGVYIEEIF